MTKMHELSEIRSLISTMKRSKNEIVSNIMLEQNYRLNLRTQRNSSKYNAPSKTKTFARDEDQYESPEKQVYKSSPNFEGSQMNDLAHMLRNL